MSFVHLHVHSQYSILDGQASIENLFNRAEELGMPALAITDHGNMYGIKEFYKFAKKHPDIKPIVGCEIYVTTYDHKLKDKDHRGYYHLILLAKNYEGYKNLMKIVSTGHIEGSYYGKPRVCREVVEKYSANLVCCSACLAGEVARAAVAGDMDRADEVVQWHKRVFGDDYYLEVQLHKTVVPEVSLDVYENQKIANEVIFKLAEKHNVKVIASNDVHFVREEDGPAHDRLICLTTNALYNDPNRLRYTQQEYLKSEEEMAALFPEHPEVISNTLEVADKIERYEIDRGHVLPVFKIDENFMKEVDVHLEKYKDIIEVGKNNKDGSYRGDAFCHSVAYLCHLTYLGAKERYGDVLTEEQAERIDFELKTICRMGFPDYFLIVQDFIAAARAMGVSVGPGRGSAAGSAVAYCIKITNIDPIKYQLLFERFLNPDRISMPDIDIDFDDDGRYSAFKYVEDTYGKDHISHVVTFGTMAAKSAIKDVARISNLPLDESNRLTKMIPDKPIVVKENGEDKEYKPTLKNCYKYIPELKNEYENGTDLVKDVLKYALQLEGTIRQTGVHACAMIIGRGDLTDYIPITTAADKATGEDVWVSQYEGCFIEDVGMLKMDFLGLRTLSIIKECLELIKKRFGVDIDIEKIPIDDKETFELYGRGDTTSVFQFESPGMKEWLQKLHPERFEDLIAMNALYRPGPMDYIPQFVARKLGQEPISYDIPDMEPYLQDTYGVTVYQEQVMLLSQELAGFTKGMADKLRKGMGKKIAAILEELKPKFIEGGIKKGHPKDILEKIWTDWEAFAKYAFNKSHATCYAWVSYQTGYLKAHYPAEFQAANLSKNLSNMEEIKKIMADCKKSRIKVLNPDVNESEARFSVNSEGNVRFGLGGIKGFGNNIVAAILEERGKNGRFTDIYDFVERMSGTVNRKAFESLLYAGAFDSFGYNRAQYSLPCGSESFIDAIIRYADLYKKDVETSSFSLFGDAEEMKPVRPVIPQMSGSVDEMELLHKEKELVGMYLSSHPLDKYAFEIENFTTCPLDQLPALVQECENKKSPLQTVRVAGFITASQTLVGKTGKQWSKTQIEDFNGNFELALFGKDHEQFMSYLVPNTAVFIEGKIDEAYFAKGENEEKKTVPYKFKVREIRLLSNVTETYTKGIRLLMNTSCLTDSFRNKLFYVIKNNKGEIRLSLMLNDQKSGYKVELVSKKFKVAVTNQFLEEIKDLGINFDIISNKNTPKS